MASPGQIRTMETVAVSLPDITESYEHCVAITQARARNFYFAFLTLPKAGRDAICAVYAFCRLLDDIADGPMPRAQKQAAIAAARTDLSDALAGRARTPVYIALADAVRRYSISERHLLEVAQGVEQDLHVTRYRTFTELREYCYLVASSVGLACLEVFGYHSPEARDAAVDLGIAMQLTNVVRDVAEDAAENRIYLPQDDLNAFGVGEDEILAGRPTPALTRMLAFQGERAKEYYGRARALFKHLPRRSRPCPMVLFGVYRTLLEQIERNGYDVFTRRATLAKSRRAQIALALWIRGLLWKSPS